MVSESDRLYRAQRWVLQAAARELLLNDVGQNERVCWCLRTMAFDPVTGGPHSMVDVLYSPRVERAHYKNLAVCASVWMCPVCAAKISEKRRVELTEVLDSHLQIDYALVTFTLQHDRSHSLKSSLDVLIDGYRFLKAGKRWQEFVSDCGLLGSIRSLEVTHTVNGWHPHLHVLMMFPKGSDVNGVGHFLKTRWLSILSGKDRMASYRRGVDFRSCESDVADYISKFGKQPVNMRRPFKWGVEHELVKSGVKMSRVVGGRTPMQLLADYAGGDWRSGQLWLEYARLFKGRRQLVWSRGLRELLGSKVEKTDEELAKLIEEDAWLLASLSFRQWKIIVVNDARGEVLDVASRGSVDELNRFLKRLGAVDEWKACVS